MKPGDPELGYKVFSDLCNFFKNIKRKEMKFRIILQVFEKVLLGFFRFWGFELFSLIIKWTPPNL